MRRVLAAGVLASLLVAGCTSGSTPADTAVVPGAVTGSGSPRAGGASGQASGCDTADSGTVSFDGVRVANATDRNRAPDVTSRAATDPTRLACLDVVAGTGAPASDTATVTVQYVGLLYRTGSQFDSSWTRVPAQFSLARTISGFRSGIGGGAGVAPMRVGGRRILIVPAAQGYGAGGNDAVPPDAPLVFVVDLLKA